MKHGFKRSLSEGEAFELVLDGLFDCDFLIEKVDRTGQRAGIDRVYTCRRTGKALKIEYKSDKRATDTANFFFETTSVDTSNKGGWVYTSTADFIFYYMPCAGLIYIFDPATLRAHIETWRLRFPTLPANNEGYKTYGVCVPICEAAQLAARVIRLVRERVAA